MFLITTPCLVRFLFSSVPRPIVTFYEQCPELELVPQSFLTVVPSLNGKERYGIPVNRKGYYDSRWKLMAWNYLSMTTSANLHCLLENGHSFWKNWLSKEYLRIRCWENNVHLGEIAVVQSWATRPDISGSNLAAARFRVQSPCTSSSPTLIAVQRF